MKNMLSQVDIKRSVTVLLGFSVIVTTITQALPSSAADIVNTPVPPTQSTPLKGSVQTTLLKTEIGLKDLVDSIKALRRVSMDLIGEIERHDLVVVGEPDVIGPVVMPAIPTPSGTMQLGDALAPRKKWLEIYLNQIATLISYLKQEEKAIIIPPNTIASVSHPWAKIEMLTKDMNQRLQNLKSLLATGDYDNLSIGREALGIYDDTSKLDKPIKQVFEIIRRNYPSQ